MDSAVDCVCDAFDDAAPVRAPGYGLCGVKSRAGGSSARSMYIMCRSDTVHAQDLMYAAQQPIPCATQVSMAVLLEAMHTQRTQRSARMPSTANKAQRIQNSN